jgi:hypothetical protein
MDPSQLGDLIAQHKWVAVSAIVIGFAVRLIKSDTKIPINIPPRARIWLALGLGVLAGVLEKVATGATWTKALADGLVAALLAVTSHEAIIASLRSGKELPIPGLMVEGARPAPTAPVTVEAPGAVETRATPKFTMPPPDDTP